MNQNGQNLPTIVGIKFSEIGKNYYFDASNLEDLKIGDHIIVETSRGWQIGELAEFVDDPKLLKNANYKPVERIANENDLRKKEELERRGEEALQICLDELNNIGLKGVKVISAEYSFDSKILSFLYSTSTEKSPDLADLKNAVEKRIQDIRIDFHKIGPRDAAKFFGGMGACGLETRCCAQFLCGFESISIRMAKKQGVSLTPSDITGMCDRLRCCLNYEYCQYVEAIKEMPRKNRLVTTPKGIGKVKDIAPLRKTVYVQLDDIGLKEFDVGEIEEVKTESGIDKRKGKKSTDARRKRDQKRNR